MKKELYEDGSYCLITSSGAPISNSTIESLNRLITDTRFEKFHFLSREGYDDVDVNEILDYLAMQE